MEKVRITQERQESLLSEGSGVLAVGRENRSSRHRKEDDRVPWKGASEAHCEERFTGLRYLDHRCNLRERMLFERSMLLV